MARVYVGTYSKYNSGSIKGAWLDLENFSDHAGFIEACKELHKDEREPELMFQDFEGFPRGFYNESHIKADVWEWLELDEDDRALLDAFQSAVDETATIVRARDAYMGKGYDTQADWAEEFLEESGLLETIPEDLRNYFNYEAYARDQTCSGIVFHRDTESTLWVFNGNA